MIDGQCWRIFYSSIRETEAGGLCEFKANLVCRESSRAARAPQGNPILKTFFFLSQQFLDDFR